jgi:hypothetical protein
MRTLLFAAALAAATVVSAETNAAELPRSYRGAWCLFLSVQNGRDVVTGERLPREMRYRRGGADCEDRITLHAETCTKLQEGGYRCGKRTISLDGDELFIEQ